MEKAEFKYVMHGPVAQHNYLCAVCRDEPAALDLSVGILQPCWSCQRNGHRLISLNRLGMILNYLNWISK